MSHGAQTLHAIARSIGVATFLGVGVGIVATAASSLFVAFVVASEHWLVLPLARGDHGPMSWWWLAALLVGGGGVVGLIRWWNRPAPMQGPANAIAAAHGLERLMPAAPGFRTTLATLVSIGSGASVGQYGPLAHLGALLGHVTAKLAGADAGRRNIGIACGAAAAISTAFNAPIAGIVFAHEVILRHFSLRAFAPVTVASSIGFVFTHFVEAHEPLFELSRPLVVYAQEYLAFALIGMAGGLVAVIYMRAIIACERAARASRIPELLRPAAAGVAVALIAYYVPNVLGVGFGTLGSALAGEFSPVDLGLILVAKLVATALCLGFGFVGGVFSPSLLIGVMFGALVGSSLDLAVGAGHGDLVVYAACGMVAVVSPVIGAPLTTILIAFELTRSYDVATAAMLCAVMSNLVSYRVFGRSFFDWQLARSGHDLSMGREKLMLSVRSVRDLANPDAPCVGESDTVAEARRVLRDGDATEAAVVDADGRLVGALRLVDIIDGGAEDPVGDFVARDALVLDPATPVWRAMHLVSHATGEQFCVAGDEDGVYRGMVTRRDLVSAYLGVSQSVRAEQHDIL